MAKRNRYRLPQILESSFNVADADIFEVASTPERRTWVLPVVTEPASFNIVISEDRSQIVFETKICEIPSTTNPNEGKFYRGLLESNASVYHGKLGLSVAPETPQAIVFTREFPKLGLPESVIADELRLFGKGVTRRFAEVVNIADNSDFPISIAGKHRYPTN